jgi:hypothetical protein
MNVPDWLWQELVGEAISKAIWPAITFSAVLAWKQFERYRKRQTISMNPANLTAEATPVYVSASIQAKSSVKATATVEKPSLARRLEELAAWYLHVS